MLSNYHSIIEDAIESTTRFNEDIVYIAADAFSHRQSRFVVFIDRFQISSGIDIKPMVGNLLNI